MPIPPRLAGSSAARGLYVTGGRMQGAIVSSRHAFGSLVYSSVLRTHDNNQEED